MNTNSMEDNIYDVVRQLVAVSPAKTQYDSKESVVFVFNMPLLVDGGPYEVEFKGESHCLRVPAVMLNSCTIQAHAPVYYPPEKITVTVYDKIQQHEPFIAKSSFEFVSRSHVLEELLERATDPAQLLCDSCGIFAADIKQFDEVMAQKIQQKTPHDFHLLEVTQPLPGETKGQANSRYPSLIHFGAAYGLTQTVAAYLRCCPAALKACRLKNIDGMCPKQIALEYGHLELSEDLQDFESHESSNPNKLQSKYVPDGRDSDAMNEADYLEMHPTELVFGESEDEYYVKMAPRSELYKNGSELRMTPEMWKAIFIAEKAVNESWRHNHLGEETAKMFSQLIQKSAREHCSSLSPNVSPGQRSAPALPPKSYPLNKKRHSIHDIPDSAPPLPPRSPLPSPRSPRRFTGFGFGELVPGERRGSDPNIFHRMQQNVDNLRISEEPGSQPPQLPARSKSPLLSRALGSLVNERRGSDPNISWTRPHSTEIHGSINEVRKSFTLPQKPPQATQNGLQLHPDLPNGYRRSKSHSLDATSMSLSPKPLPRQPRPVPRQRTASCEPAAPVHSVTTRTLSEPDEYGFVTVVTK